MPIPLLPLAAAGLGGGLIMSLLKGGKKGAATTAQTTTYHPYTFYQPTVSKAIQYPSYQFIIDSPLARQEVTKKQAVTQQPSIAAPITAAPIGVSEPVTAGASIMPIVLIGGAAVIGYTLLTKKKRK